MAKSIREALKSGVKKAEEVISQEDVHANESDVDVSPVIQALSVKTLSVKGYTQTDIVANIHSPTGIVSKRTVIPGGITAAKLMALLEGVASW